MDLGPDRLLHGHDQRVVILRSLRRTVRRERSVHRRHRQLIYSLRVAEHEKDLPQS